MIHNTLALSPDEIMRGRVLLGELHAAQTPAEREEIEARLAEHFANLARRHLGEVSDSNEGPLTFGEVE
jgi:hypothetical protein